MAETRLTISYSTRDFDIRSTDILILGAVPDGLLGGSGQGFGQRDLEFYLPSKAEAERVQRLVSAAGLPVPLEFDIWEMEDDA